MGLDEFLVDAINRSDAATYTDEEIVAGCACVDHVPIGTRKNHLVSFAEVIGEIVRHTAGSGIFDDSRQCLFIAHELHRTTDTICSFGGLVGVAMDDVRL